MSEIWKSIQGYDGQYEVSNIGRIRSLIYKNKVCSKVRDIPKIIAQSYNANGYYRVQLRRKGHSVHSLVLSAFTGSRPNGYYAGHLNGIRDDNRAENLKWVTPQENQDHRKIHGTYQCGESCGASKLKKEQVVSIVTKYLKGGSPKEIAKEFGISRPYVHMLGNGEQWKHLRPAIQSAMRSCKEDSNE